MKAARHIFAIALGSLLAVACSDDGGGQATDAGPDDTCPQYLEVQVADARLEVGWNGLGTGLAVFPTGTRFIAELYDCDDECGQCKVRGPVPDTRENIHKRQRCVGDLGVCQTDADCGSEGPCRTMISGPIDGVAPGLCLSTFMNAVDPDDLLSAIDGVFDVRTGELNLARLSIAINTYNGPCDRCASDVTPFDGNPDGRCANAPTVRCDVSAINNTTPANPAQPYVTSYDCPPGISLGSTPLLALNASTSSQSWVMDDTRPFCTAGGMTFPPGDPERCWCGACADSTACFKDSDCIDGSSCGVTSTTMGPITSLPNGCNDGMCNFDTITQRGSCIGQVPDPLNPPLGTMDGPIGCFPSTGEIRVSGSAEVFPDHYKANIGALSCQPPAIGIDAFGYPGIQYLQLGLVLVKVEL